MIWIGDKINHNNTLCGGLIKISFVENGCKRESGRKGKGETDWLVERENERERGGVVCKSGQNY